MIDRILHNANIYTLNPDAPRASALAIIGERIVAIGSDDEILPLASSRTQIDNLNGRFVTPGLVDAHMHWELTAKARHAVNLFEVPSKAEALRRIEAHHATLQPGDWIYGTGWTQELWEGQGFPTAEDLEAVTGDTPAYLLSKSLHAAWVNRAALRIAGIDAATPDPYGGQILRHEDGTPTGILFEAPAMHLVSQHMPGITTEKLAEWMRELQAEAWQVGLVGFHDFDNPSCLVALQMLRERGELGLRVLKQVNLPYIEAAHASGLRFGFGDDWLRIGALKLFADGALGPRTASMIAPYEGEPDNYGVIVTDKETMYAAVSQASALGLPSTIHAIGDQAVRDVLDIFETVRGEEAARGLRYRERRHRIEHVQLIHPDDITRLADLDIIASMQPIHAASDMVMADQYWGARARYSYAWRAQLDAGAVLAFGSDSPVDSFHTWQGIYTAMTRRRPQDGYPGGEGWYAEERLSLEETLSAYTYGPAYAAGIEGHSGYLGRGCLADCIVLDRDLFASDPQAILETQVQGTLVGGVWRYRQFD